MAINVVPEVVKVEVITFRNEFTPRLANMEVETIRMDQSTCVYRRWPTTIYSLKEELRKEMSYPY